MKILVTMARSFVAMDIARHLRWAGHEVYMADNINTKLCRYSKSITGFFKVPSPRFNTQQFIAAINDIVVKHGIDLIIPTFEESYYLAQHRDQLPATCQLFCADFDTILSLHNKWWFSQKLKSYKIPAPESILLPAGARLDAHPWQYPYIIKPCFSRAAQAQYYRDPKEQINLPVMEITTSMIAQQWITGKAYCSYSTCYQGKVFAHSVYPVQTAIDKKSCIYFEAIRHPAILAWVKKFVALEKYTGQIAFDFIQADNGILYPIECNPRATSGVHLFHVESNFGKVFIEQPKTMIQPTIGSRRQILLAMLVYGWRQSANSTDFRTYCQRLLHTPDVVYNRNDKLYSMLQTFCLPYNIVKAITHKLPITSLYFYDLEWNEDNRLAAN